MRLLLVEDNISDAQFLEASLKRSRALGIKMTHVTSLKDGATALKSGNYDCLLLDMGLPDGNGLECVEAMQQADPDMPIVVLSGQDDEDFAVSILNKGVQDYLVKWEGKGRTILRAIRYAIERKRTDKRLTYLAQYDNLTGVPNREFFTDQLDRAIARARRAGSKIALFYLDLDQFKSVNDTLGHEAGDALLKGAADRLQEAIRSGDVLARLGGDEFAIIVENLERARHAEAIARHLIASFDEPFELSGRKLSITPSIGITVYPDDSTTAVALLKNADIAMYKAKEDGRNSFKFFTERMHKDLVTRHKMEDDIKVALDNDEFLLLYQPKVDMRNHRLKGMEALIRWDNPERGIVSPMDFIPAAEECGYIVPLGYWVLGEVCRTLKRWEEQKFVVPPISINVSAKQFQQADFAKQVAFILDSNHVDPSLIELELTESVLMEDTVSAKRTLTRLKDIGVRISIDDFGTGHSCLAYLRKFPIDILKIDKSFVDDVTQCTDSDLICKAIISLAQSLKLSTVAEGIETRDQLAFLKANGCDVAQGYLFGRPKIRERIEPMLDVGGNEFSLLAPTVPFSTGDTQIKQITQISRIIKESQ